MKRGKKKAKRDLRHVSPLEEWVDRAKLRNFVDNHLKIHLKQWEIKGEEADMLMRLIMISLRQELQDD